MTTIDNIGVPGSPMNVSPLTVWQAAVRDKLLALEAAQPPPQVRVTRPNITDRLVEVWDGAAWAVLDYDSGWRDIAATANPVGTAVLSRLQIRRTNHVVALQIILGDTQANPSRITLAPTPTFFRPNNRANYFSIPADESNIFPGVELRLNVSQSAIGYGGPTYNGTYDGIVMWSTTEGIPTSLPGIAGGMLRPSAPGETPPRPW